MIQGISIIIPYYNSSKTIERTLNSCALINYPEFEVVLINDGSTEPKTTQFLTSLLSKYSYKSQFINETINKGLPFTRNIGIKASKFNYIIFLDADDELDPQRFNHNYLKPLFDNECDILFMDYTEIFPDGQRINKSRADYVKFEDITAFFLQYSAVSVIFTYRKSFLEEIGYFRRIPAEDKDLIFRLSLTDARFRYIPINSYFYYQAIQNSRTNRGHAFLLEGIKKPFFLFAYKELKRKNKLTLNKMTIISTKLSLTINEFLQNGYYKYAYIMLLRIRDFPNYYSILLRILFISVPKSIIKRLLK
ncbi:glycosyltransferase family 2 protein [bacterium]|nr:MAG: glycosyltransferase family 2 protein [bacterium]